MCFVGPLFFAKHIEVLRLGCSTPEQESEERKCNYERYRGLVQNDFASSEYPPVLVMPCLLCLPPSGYVVFLYSLTSRCPSAVSEEQCLYQIQMDELYGGLQRPNEDEKKKLVLSHLFTFYMVSRSMH